MEGDEAPHVGERLVVEREQCVHLVVEAVVAHRAHAESGARLSQPARQALHRRRANRLGEPLERVHEQSHLVVGGAVHRTEDPPAPPRADPFARRCQQRKRDVLAGLAIEETEEARVVPSPERRVVERRDPPDRASGAAPGGAGEPPRRGCVRGAGRGDRGRPDAGRRSPRGRSGSAPSRTSLGRGYALHGFP